MRKIKTIAFLLIVLATIGCARYIDYKMCDNELRRESKLRKKTMKKFRPAYKYKPTYKTYYFKNENNTSN